MDNTIRFRGDDWERVQSALWQRTDVESAAVLLADVWSNGEDTTLAVQRILPVPDRAYRSRTDNFIEIDPVWMNAQCREARHVRRAILTIHTHLSDADAWFSWADDAGDRRLMPALAVQAPDLPHGSMNLTRGDAAGRVLVHGELRPARIAISGTGLDLLPRSRASIIDPAHSRQELALGREGQARLRRIRAGVVGLGGTGSVVVALLARLGLESLSLFDDDILDETNLSRVLGSGHSDLPATRKVVIAEREARRAAPATTIASHAKALASEGDILALVGCDVVFSCVDRLIPRVLLNRFAYSALVPVIDMGSAFRVDSRGKLVSQGGKVAIIGPGRPCLWCWGDLDAERVRVETLSVEQRAVEEAAGYVEGVDAPQPSVVTFNTTLAATATTLLLQLVTGYAGETPTPDRLNFNFATGTVTRVTAPSRPGCTFCAPAP
jgi:molybdopterin-synthase adenylyltransferase